jgi:hypothetical protein
LINLSQGERTHHVFPIFQGDPVIIGTCIHSLAVHRMSR